MIRNFKEKIVLSVFVEIIYFSCINWLGVIIMSSFLLYVHNVRYCLAINFELFSLRYLDSYNVMRIMRSLMLYFITLGNRNL